MNWKFVNTGFQTGSFNMYFDEKLASRLRDGSGHPTLRVYGWNPPAISIGANQRVEDFDLARLEREGIGLVRRPTGGRAILHAQELTYSIVMPAATRSSREIYSSVSTGLLAGIQLIGIDAQFAPADRALPRSFEDPASIPCFASSARWEIQVDGRKIVGSAQRRYGTVVLQHGSLLLGPQHLKLPEFLAPGLREADAELGGRLADHTIDAETVLGRRVGFEEAVSCVRRGFERAWQILFEEETLDPDFPAMFSEPTQPLYRS